MFGGWMKGGAMKGSRGRFAVAFVLMARSSRERSPGLRSRRAAVRAPDASNEPVRFTWGNTGEPSSLNPHKRLPGVDFYFWAASYHLLINYAEASGHGRPCDRRADEL